MCFVVVSGIANDTVLNINDVILFLNKYSILFHITIHYITTFFFAYDNRHSGILDNKQNLVTAKVYIIYTFSYSYMYIISWCFQF